MLPACGQDRVLIPGDNVPMNARSDNGLTRRLRALLGGDGVVAGHDALSGHADEPRGRFRARPLALVRPASTRQVAAVVSLCRDAGVAMVARGGNTGLVGGQAATQPGTEVVISLERLRGIRQVDAAGASLVAEAGCTLQAVREHAAAAGLQFPLHLASEGSATIGGNIATNAGGHMTLRYGNTRRQVLGLEVVLADGRILDGLTALRKDNSGYDLNQLFIGSEGTLGIVTAASLALVPAPRQSLTVLAGLASLPASVELLARVRRELGETVSAFELIPRRALEYVLDYLPDASDPMDRAHEWYVALQVDSAVRGRWLEETALEVLERAMEDNVLADVVVAGSEQQAGRLWALRDAISPAQKLGGVSLKHDVSVPVAAIPEFVESTCRALAGAVPGIRPCIFGHLGDGNLHFNLSQPEDMDAATFRERERECNRIVFDRVVACRGSIAAEHGIGQLRRDELARRADPVRLELMGRLKHALDPEGLLNPGKVIGA